MNELISTQQTYDVDVIIPSLQMRKLRLGGIKFC